ncbi:aspartate dehydrogenase [Tateyamaria sp. Alg231-49]|uniref:aspartate dehydrogenase n=1 Tax=Tateyamaria sp. Alg231-49 TaxID=1922219 RepID=UPI000D553BA9|nr:aspartate dehydrogenase [Tateyamaria sp. Alg231-49]
MKIGLIGQGAIARYVTDALSPSSHEVVAVLLRPERARANAPLEFGSVDALPADIDVMIDCAGHTALAAYGPPLLARGTDVITVSLGALADQVTAGALKDAATAGQSKLHLASGAIGALDCLRAARVGTLDTVTYTGRKPPQGWIGSPAEDVLDLAGLTQGAHTHFEGTARQAALAYPKNANVAAAVALAGLGFDDTRVQLIADADISHNIHEVTAAGDFGTFQFQISGKALPDNPRSSALAAMSVVAKLDQLSAAVTL